jgi:hypothetical protein
MYTFINEISNQIHLSLKCMRFDVLAEVSNKTTACWTECTKFSAEPTASKTNL